MSDFGKGLTYCLALFLAHAATVGEFRRLEEKSNQDRVKPFYGYPSSWFNGAGDHFFELQWENAPTKELKKRCRFLRDSVLHWRLEGEPTWKDVEWALRETKDILMEIDRYLNVPVEKGQYE